MYGCCTSRLLVHCPADDVAEIRIRMPSKFLLILFPVDEFPMEMACWKGREYFESGKVASLSPLWDAARMLRREQDRQTEHQVKVL